jgi:hypothetical protein
MNIDIQYCYAHLLREVEKLFKEFPEEKEIEIFVSKMSISLTRL